MKIDANPHPKINPDQTTQPQKLRYTQTSKTQNNLNLGIETSKDRGGGAVG